MGHAPTGPAHTGGFGLSQGHSQSKSMEPLQTHVLPRPAVERGWLRATPGEGFGPQVERGCPCLPVSWAFGLLGPLRGSVCCGPPSGCSGQPAAAGPGLLP